VSLHVLPPPVLEPGSTFLMLSTTIGEQVVDGALGECVACRRICWTWWSPAPPSGFVALHRDRCPLRLRQFWAEMQAEGIEEEPPPVAMSSGRGAYGRRRTAPHATDKAIVTLAVRRGTELPQGFTPGPFWKPGYSHLEPWVVLFSSGAGGGQMPFGCHEDRARTKLRHLHARPIAGYATEVVGAVLLSPDGTRIDEWGEAPMPGVVRWEGLTQLPEWRRCSACGTPRWPGSWVTLHSGRCRACQEPFEMTDPRPWPPDPADPGLATAPEWLGGPKKLKKTTVKKGVGIS
jgi:hypothetical protein